MVGWPERLGSEKVARGARSGRRFGGFVLMCSAIGYAKALGNCSDTSDGQTGLDPARAIARAKHAFGHVDDIGEPRLAQHTREPA